MSNFKVSYSPICNIVDVWYWRYDTFDIADPNTIIHWLKLLPVPKILNLNIMYVEIYSKKYVTKEKYI